jgi:activator of HSP90 ATPase
MTVKTKLVPGRVHRYSRRKMIAGTIAGTIGGTIAGTIAGALGMGAAHAQETSRAAAGAKAIVPAKTIHDEEDFHAAPEKIYEALLDAKQFQALSGGRSAEIHREAGGTFSIFAGHIVGINLELVPGRRIIQAWRAVSWPDGIYSIARFELRPHGSGTRIVFDHTGFPSELAEHLESGWQENYWQALRTYLG